MRLLLNLLAVLLSLSTTGAQAERSALTHYDLRNTNGWPEIDFAVRRAWYQGDYKALEAELSISPDVKAPDGSPRQALAYRTIEQIVISEGSRHPGENGRLEYVETWQKAFPESAAPKIVMAIMLYNFSVRNPDPPPDNLPTAGYMPQSSGLAEMEAVLRSAYAEAKSQPYYFALAVQLGIARRAPYDELYIIADEERDTAPGYLEASYRLFDHLVDQVNWSGSTLDVAIRSLTATASRIPRPGDYARVYLWLYQGNPSLRFLDIAAPDWALLKDGLAALSRVYATRRLDSQSAALFCLAGDRSAAGVSFARLGSEPIDSAVWKIPKFYEDCKKWSGQ